MGKRRRDYSREFKIEAVQLMERSDKSTQELAKDLGVSTSSLNRWRREYRADAAQAFPGNGNLKARDQEVMQLKRELRQVEQERDVLKKALAIFTQEPR